MKYLGICLAFALMTAPGDAATSAGPKQPTGPWRVDVAGNECLLIRPYGTSADPLFLAVSSAPMDGGSQFTILYKRDWRNLEHGPAIVVFDGGPPIEANFSAKLLLSRSKALKVDTLRSVSVSQDKDASEKFAREAVSVSIEAQMEFSGTFALPNQTAALRELGACVAKLGVEWGYSLDEQKRLSVPAKHPGGLSRIFNYKDYPPGAVRRNEMGLVRARIRVDDRGNPSECAVLNSSGSGELDTATCTIIRHRARFTPALDVDGKAVRSVYIANVNWLMAG